MKRAHLFGGVVVAMGIEEVAALATGCTGCEGALLSEMSINMSFSSVLPMKEEK